jgi:drug/metabolite transporter (DMT)-like permease
MIRLLTILVLALVLEAIGVVLLSHGLKQIGELRQFTAAEVGRLLWRGCTNPALVTGVFMEAVFFGALLYLLKNADVSLIWPLTSLGFVLTTLAAKFIRHEQVSGMRWSGVCLIVVGAVLVGYSEKIKPARPNDALSLAPSEFSKE